MSGIGRKEFSQPEGEVEQKISALFYTDALHIVEDAQRFDVCAVTGAWGNGKSYYLIPRAMQVARSYGFESLAVTGHNFPPEDNQSLDRIVSLFHKTNRGIFFFDESIVLTRLGGLHAVEHIFFQAKFRGWKFVPITSFHPQNRDFADESVKIWTHLADVHNLSLSIIHLPDFRLPQDLAREFVQYVSRKLYRRDPNPDTLEVMLSILPHNLRLLSMLSLQSLDTPETFIDYVRHMHHLYRDKFSPDEYEKLKAILSGGR